MTDSLSDAKLAYHKPEMRFYGQVTSMTLNTTTGSGGDQMANPGTFRKTV